MSDSNKPTKSEDSKSSGGSTKSTVVNIKQEELIQVIHNFEVEIARIEGRQEQHFDSSLGKVNAEFLKRHIHTQKQVLEIITLNTDLLADIGIAKTEIETLKRRVATKEMAYKLPDSTPVFSGKTNENVAEWLYIVNTSLINAGIGIATLADEQKRVRFLTPFLKGIALQFVIQKQNVPATIQAGGYAYTDLNTDFITMFQPSNLVHRVRSQLAILKQNGNFNTYLLNFQLLVNQLTLTQMSNDERRSLFINGLNESYQYEVMRDRTKTTYEDAIDIAKLFDQCQQKPALIVNMCKKVNVALAKNGKTVKVNTATSKSGKNFRKIICNFCKKPGHKANVCKAKGASATPNHNTQQNGNTKKNLVCWTCKKSGHKASECRSRASTNMAQAHTVTTQSHHSLQSREPEQVDHVAEKFWKLTTAIATHSSHGNVDEMLYVRGTVQQIPMKLYFDTGATASIISARMVHQHQFLIKQSDLKIKSANNSITPVIGITETMEITIEGHSCLLSLLVMDHDDHDVLLGINWFEQFPQSGIFPHQKKLESINTISRYSKTIKRTVHSHHI
jgi:hypothetical protein